MIALWQWSINKHKYKNEIDKNTDTNLSEINIGSCRRCQRLPGSASSQRGGPGYDSAAFRYSTHLFLLQILTTNIPSSSTSTHIHQLENLLGCIVSQRAWGGHMKIFDNARFSSGSPIWMGEREGLRPHYARSIALPIGYGSILSLQGEGGRGGGGGGGGNWFTLIQ